MSYFALKNVAPLTIILTKVWQDFSFKLYNSCIKNDKSVTKSFLLLHAIWVSVLCAAIRYTAKGVINKKQWIGVLSMAMFSTQIECIPGTYQSRLSY